MKIEIEKIVNNYSKMVFQIAYQNCFNKFDAEDITQDVIIKLWNNIDKIKNENHLKAWLIRTTITTTIDCNRKSNYTKEVSLEDRDGNVEEGKNDEYNDVYDAIQKLKPEYRNIIYLFYYQGYKTKEIANILDMNINTVSTNLARAKSELKEFLGGME